MIMPTKYIKENESLLALGALILEEITDEGSTLSVIWDNLKDDEALFNYKRFILTLDVLFLLGLVNIKNNKIIKVSQDDS